MSEPMTREDAIEILSGKNTCTHYWEGRHYKDALLMAIAALRREGELQWCPIETVPHGQEVLLAAFHETPWIASGSIDDSPPEMWIDVKDDLVTPICMHKPTHWMPKPQSPKEQEPDAGH